VSTGKEESNARNVRAETYASTTAANFSAKTAEARPCVNIYVARYLHAQTHTHAHTYKHTHTHTHKHTRKKEKNTNTLMLQSTCRYTDVKIYRQIYSYK